MLEDDFNSILSHNDIHVLYFNCNYLEHSLYSDSGIYFNNVALFSQVCFISFIFRIILLGDGCIFKNVRFLIFDGEMYHIFLQ